MAGGVGAGAAATDAGGLTRRYNADMRRLYLTLAVVSGLLCAALPYLWWRSHWYSDRIFLNQSGHWLRIETGVGMVALTYDYHPDAVSGRRL